MPYRIEHSISVRDTTERLKFIFSTNGYGTVYVKKYSTSGMLDGDLVIPKDFIVYFIDALNKLKCA
jgi:hypothetical protein